MRDQYHAVPAIAVLTLLVFVSAAPGVSAADPKVPMIVVLARNADVDEALARGKRKHGVTPDHVFRFAARGYAAALTKAQARAIEREEDVDAVVPDAAVELATQSTPAGVRRVGATRSPLTHIDTNDLASHRANVDVAIIDTGIQPDHPDLRVAGGYDCSRPSSPVSERSWSSRWRDQHGHGTHVAGIVGALDNDRGVVGVAPGARLWSVRVFDSTGFSRISWIACGIDWIASKRDPNDASRPLIEVANMSLRDDGRDDGNCGYSNNDIEHRAICRSVDRGTTYVVAAGNDRNSAGNWRPASYNEVITVSAMADYDGRPGGLASATCTAFGKRDGDDTFADFSNYGGDVDITAPGVCVRSTLPGSTYGTISGTSMATPHVAGGAALYLIAHPGTAPNDVRAALRAAGLFDWRTSTDRDTTIDPLLDVSSFGAGEGLRLDSSTTSVRLWAGGPSSTVRFRLTRLDGFAGDASLSVDGLPDGVTASLSRTTFGGRFFGEATVTLTAGSGAAQTDSDIAIVASAEGIEAHHSIRLRVDVDTTAPSVSGVKESFRKPATVSTSNVWVTTRWTASDAGSGVASSNIGERREEGDWTSIATTAATTRSRSARLPYLTDIQHRVRAKDVVGNTSDFVEGPSIRLRGYSEGTSAATWSSGWSRVSNSNALGGSYRYATASGASVTFRFTGRAVAWVARTASTLGNARVYLDGSSLGLVGLGGSSAWRQVVFARDVSSGSHTLKIVVLATSGRPRIEVDGWLVMQ
jgi:subtilisin